MAEPGFLRARAYTSRARIPLEDVAVAITDPSGKLVALRLTNESGLTDPVTLEVPDFSESQQPEEGKPYATVHLTARLNGYEQIEVSGVQVFAETMTLQDLEMIPLSEYPNRFDKAEYFDTPPQNL